MSTPKTRYANSDGVHIAYQVIGDGPIDLVVAPGFVTHCDLNWTAPAYVDFIRRLATFARVIVFDKRGTGLSDVSDDLGSFETRMADIVAVMDAARSERASLFGYSEGGPIAVLFAATHPDRVRSLILSGTFPSGGYIDGDMRDRLQDAIDNWGEGRTAPIFLNDGDSPMVQRFMGLYERAGASPGAARWISEAVRNCDVTPVLAELRVPTVVVHQRGDPFAPATWGRAMAKSIPEARFVEVDGSDHLPWIGNVAPLVAEIEASVTGTAITAPPERLLGTVLFTDLVDSTAAAARVGDESWAATIQQHNDFCRDVFDEFDAWAIKSTGDGFMACFTTPEAAVRCAFRLLAQMPELELLARAGLHTGELERVDIDDIAGMTPNIAARVANLAADNELLASRMTSDLLIGSDLARTSLGPANLKGVPQPVEIVRIEAPGTERHARVFDSATARSDRLILRVARGAPWLMRTLARLTDR